MAGHYSDGTAELLPAVLDALPGLTGETFTVGRIVLGGWSEGAEGVRANHFAGVMPDGIALADGIQSPFGSTRVSPKVAVWLPFVDAARAGSKSFRSSASSIPTVVSSSTHDTHVLLVPSLADTPCGTPENPGVATEGNAVVYSTCGTDAAEHIAHLQVLLPRMVAEALSTSTAGSRIPWKRALGWLGGVSGMSLARWNEKANAYAAGWMTLFHVSPTRENAALGLSVAEHETSCGDAWPGSHDWGATQKRVTSAAERTVLAAAGVVLLPHGTTKEALAMVAPARAAIAAAIDAGTLPPLDHEELHVDSSPVNGWYFVYFWAFPTDEEGAQKFIHVLAENRLTCRSILEGPKAPDGGTYALAAAMYASHYYEGIHDPHSPGGVQENIQDYATALSRVFPGIQQALTSWIPGATPPAPAGVDLCTIVGIQHALNLLGQAPALIEDGIAGPKTTAAIVSFQKAHGLTADGKSGPKTRAALTAALLAIGTSASSDCSGSVP